MRKPPPTRQTRSISSWPATPSPSIRRDSRVKGRAQRLATKPIASRARIGVRPIAAPASVAAARAGSALASPATISTSFIAGGGLKKCMPTIRSGRSASAAIAVTESEEVFVASTVSGPQTASRRANSSRFSSSSSGAASITRSHPARSSSAVDRARSSRSSALAAASGSRRPRSAARSIPLRVRPMPSSRASGVGVVQGHFEPALGSDLGDPGAHRAGADHADALHLHHPLPI